MIPENDKLSLVSSRLEALGDGIFGVAMTILVINLALPAVNGNTWKSFALAIHNSASGYLCYVISFIVLGIMWFGHRMMFEYIGKSNRYFIYLGVFVLHGYMLCSLYHSIPGKIHPALVCHPGLWIKSQPL